MSTKNTMNFFSLLIVGAGLMLFQNCGAGPKASSSASETTTIYLPDNLPIRSTSDKLNIMSSEVSQLSRMIASSTNPVFKKQIAQHKRFVLNQISLTMSAKSCQDIISLEPSMDTGIYKLYPESGKPPMIALCIVEQGRVVSEKIYNGPVASN